MNNYINNLKYLLKIEESKNPHTTLAAKIGTCERSLKRWLNEETIPIHRFKAKIQQLIDEKTP